MAEKLCTLRGAGGGGGKYTETSLWTNPSPSSNFAAQTITLSDNMTNYKYLKVTYINATGSSVSNVDIVPVSAFITTGPRTRSALGSVGMTGGSARDFARNYKYVADNQINFGTACALNYAAAENNRIIPLEILGLNELQYKPDDYIVTSGTFTIASLNTPVTVTIGFKPKKLTAWLVSASNNFESFTYDDSISTTTCTRIMVASGSNINGGTRNIGQSQTNDLISINDDGFTLASGVATGTWNYFATGVAE